MVNTNQIQFKKLQYIDFRFDFQNAIILNNTNLFHKLNPLITNVNENLSLVAVKNLDINRLPITTIEYYYGDNSNKFEVFKNNIFQT